MGRTQTMVQLNDTLLEVLDQRAVESGRSRSDLIREAIEQYYKEDIEAAIDRAMVEGYTRVPDDDEFDGLAEANITLLGDEDLW
jgi:metal-responsive CopG/Arc/MetJ family transcriptional regulator